MYSKLPINASKYKDSKVFFNKYLLSKVFILRIYYVTTVTTFCYLIVCGGGV